MVGIQQSEVEFQLSEAAPSKQNKSVSEIFSTVLFTSLSQYNHGLLSHTKHVSSDCQKQC